MNEATPISGTPIRRRTVIEFHGANCTWCLNHTLAHLRAHDSVTSARLHAASGCIEVNHTASDIDDLLAGTQLRLRGWRQADNGERVMIDLDVHRAGSCLLRTVR